MSITKEQWSEIVERGALVPPYYEPARPAGDLYKLDENGKLDMSEVVGFMFATYYDKRYVDWYYYSFTALRPDKDQIGIFYYNEFDEDEGTYDEGGSWTEIVDLDIINSFAPERELLEEEIECMHKM